MVQGAISLSKEHYALIFQTACARNPNDPTWRRALHPLVLGQVCRTWRYFAWNTPELWQTLDLRPRREADDVAQSQLLVEWLDRSRWRPLDIIFEMPEGSEPVKGSLRRGLLKSMCRMLLMYAHLWRTIRFKLPMFCYEYMYRQQIPAQVQELRRDGVEVIKPQSSALTFSSLVSVSLQYSDRKHISTSIPTPVSFQGAFNLRSLAFTCGSLNQKFFQKYPTHSITSLLLDEMHHIHIWNLFKEMSNLQILRMMYPMHSPDIHPPSMKHPTRIQHDPLQSIGVSFRRFKDFCLFFDAVAFRNLQTMFITLYVGLNWDARCKKSIISFCAASACALTKLNIKCRIMADRHLVPVLEAVPTLTELCIQDRTMEFLSAREADILQTGLGSEFFWRFNPQVDKSFLPRLQVLAYKGTLAVNAMECIKPLVIRALNNTPVVRELSKTVAGIATLTSGIIYADMDGGFSVQDRLWVEITGVLMQWNQLTLAHLDGRTSWKFIEEDDERHEDEEETEHKSEENEEEGDEEERIEEEGSEEDVSKEGEEEDKGNKDEEHENKEKDENRHDKHREPDNNLTQRKKWRLIRRL